MWQCCITCRTTSIFFFTHVPWIRSRTRSSHSDLGERNEMDTHCKIEKHKQKTHKIIVLYEPEVRLLGSLWNKGQYCASGLCLRLFFLLYFACLSSSFTDMFSLVFPPSFYLAYSTLGLAWLCQLLVSAKYGRFNSICAWQSLLEHILALFLPKEPEETYICIF